MMETFFNQDALRRLNNLLDVGRTRLADVHWGPTNTPHGSIESVCALSRSDSRIVLDVVDGSRMQPQTTRFMNSADRDEQLLSSILQFRHTNAHAVYVLSRRTATESLGSAMLAIAKYEIDKGSRLFDWEGLESLRSLARDDDACFVQFVDGHEGSLPARGLLRVDHGRERALQRLKSRITDETRLAEIIASEDVSFEFRLDRFDRRSPRVTRPLEIYDTIVSELGPIPFPSLALEFVKRLAA